MYSQIDLLADRLDWILEGLQQLLKRNRYIFKALMVRMANETLMFVY